MRRLTFRLAVALFTFIVGITAASIWLLHWNQKPSSKGEFPLSSNSSSQVDEVAREANSLNAILSGFIFVGSDAYVSNSIPSHSMEVKPTPTIFDMGQQYVFHSRYSDNDYCFDELQNRIRAQGFNILSAEKFGWRNVGGLWFSIKFSNEHHQFNIFNKPDRQILANTEQYKTMSVDDYVLAVEGKNN
jgi:hypothetical protein